MIIVNQSTYKAVELVEHRDHERLAVWAKVNQAVPRDERAPGVGGVEVVVEPAVKGEGDGLALDVPYSTYPNTKGLRI